MDSKDKPEKKSKPLSASCRSPVPLQRLISLQYTEQSSMAPPLPPTEMPSTCCKGHCSEVEKDSVPPAYSRKIPQTLPRSLEKQCLSTHTLLLMPSLRVPSYIQSLTNGGEECPLNQLAFSFHPSTGKTEQTTTHTGLDTLIYLRTRDIIVLPYLITSHTYSLAPPQQYIHWILTSLPARRSRLIQGGRANSCLSVLCRRSRSWALPAKVSRRASNHLHTYSWPPRSGMWGRSSPQPGFSSFSFWNHFFSGTLLSTASSSFQAP